MKQKYQGTPNKVIQTVVLSQSKRRNDNECLQKQVDVIRFQKSEDNNIGTDTKQ